MARRCGSFPQPQICSKKVAAHGPRCPRPGLSPLATQGRAACAAEEMHHMRGHYATFEIVAARVLDSCRTRSAAD
eukprot:7012150-Pyramimonas_sp.AAC.1